MAVERKVGIEFCRRCSERMCSESLLSLSELSAGNFDAEALINWRDCAVSDEINWHRLTIR